MLCYALAQGIEKYLSGKSKYGFRGKSVNVEFLVNGDNLTREIFSGQSFKVTIKNWIEKYGELEKKLKKVDIVIIDSYLASKKIYNYIHQIFSHQLTNSFTRKLICVDDYNRINYPSCIVVNGSINGEKLDYPILFSPDKYSYLLGREYVILRKEFWRVPKKYIRKRIKDVLITFGGRSHASFIKKLLQFLETQFPGFEYHIVASDFQSVRNIRENINLYSNLTALRMRSLMLDCDFSISAGGQTLYELARIGVPTIGICFGENQMNNLKGFHEEGFLEYVGRYSDNKVFNRIEKAVKTLVPQEARNRRHEIGRKLVDSKGLERILVHLSKTNNVGDTVDIFDVRTITRADCRDLWLWRNNPEVRKWSFSTGKIEYKKHKCWFEREFRDSRVRMYIAEGKKGKKIGQVRFDSSGKESVYISVNLNPNFFGKGLGSKVIKKATETFLEEESGVKEIVSEIAVENIGSRKAFQEAGYMFSHNTVKNNRKVFIYKFTL